MNSFIGWIGGKKLLRKEIIGRFPEQEEYDRYVEVFGGAGWVLFGKDPSGIEVYNDANGALVNLFKIAKYHPEALQKELDSMLFNAREVFEDCKECYNLESETDIQRAAQFFCLIKCSYGTNLKHYSGRNLNVKSSINFIQDVSKRLNKVIVEHRDFEKVIKMYNDNRTLYYLDPPYHSTEKYYSVAFGEEDHRRLRNCLGQLKGKFILSYNDDDFIRDLYQGYKIEAISRRNTLVERYDMPENKRQYNELIISNY